MSRDRKRSPARAFELIDVLGSGAVVLGDEVTCDGFHQDRHVRIQTHIHTDHLTDFSTSKSRELVMSAAVRDLLSFDHPDLDFRANIHVLSPGNTWEFGGSTIMLEYSGHMLGACQAIVVLEDGIRVGYSGDFSWPLDRPIAVDALVLDATYGSPELPRRYNQVSADRALAELINDSLARGPVQLLGNSGVVERALMVIRAADVAEDVPIVGNARLCAAVDVHIEHKWPLPRLIDVDKEEGHRAIREGRYIRCWQLSEGGRIEGIVEGTTISLTKYRAHDVVVEFAESNFRVGMSNHADYAGTVQYVESTGAEYVVTDACRGQDRARVLANTLRDELGVEARPSSNARGHKWGG